MTAEEVDVDPQPRPRHRGWSLWLFGQLLSSPLGNLMSGRHAAGSSFQKAPPSAAG